MVTSPGHLRIFVYSIPRSRSHLLMKLLGTHPALATSQYPLEVAYAATPSPGHPGDADKIHHCFGISDPTADEFTYQAQTDTLQKLVATTEREGKMLVVKEHIYAVSRTNIADRGYDRPPLVDRMLDVSTNEPTSAETPTTILNPTVFPDRFFLTFSPIILTRHPARVFPSFLRAEKALGYKVVESDLECQKIYRRQRDLLDFWTSAIRNSPCDAPGKREWPVVLDGDRLVADTAGLMAKLCEKLHIDPAFIQYTWVPEHPQGVELTDAVSVAFFGDIRSSTGVNVNPGALKVPNMEDEIRKWTTEWDEDTAEKLKSSVEAAMEDYEYLLQFHI